MSDDIKSDRPHHPYSPSSLQSLESCPCYRGRETAHVRSIAGTLAHKVAETGQDSNKLSDEDALNVADCMDFLERRREALAQPVEELSEIYLPIDDLIFDDAKSTTAGYPDKVLITGHYAEMFDWKFGVWPVESADNNLQAIAYVLGLFRLRPDVNTIRFFFKQPAINGLTEAMFIRAQIPELYLRIQTVVARARAARKDDNFAVANPTVPNCNFCANLGRCPKVAAFACKVGSKFHPVEIPESISPNAIMSPKQTALGLRLAQVLKIWCDSFRSTLTDRIICGEAEIPEGYDIVQQSRREILDPAAFKKVARKYLKAKEYEAALSIEFGPVESLISEHAPRLQKKATVEEFQQQLLEAGAVKKGEPFSYLKAVPQTNNETKT